MAGGHAVTADRLADDLWPGEGPAERPADTANALQALVSRLRQAAGRDLIEYTSGSYRLAIDPACIDAVAFEHLVSRGRAAFSAGEAARAATFLADAMALWRGRALADVADAPFAAGPVARLTELQLAAPEDLTEARLALGQGAARRRRGRTRGRAPAQGTAAGPAHARSVRGRAAGRHAGRLRPDPPPAGRPGSVSTRRPSWPPCTWPSCARTRPWPARPPTVRTMKTTLRPPWPRPVTSPPGPATCPPGPACPLTRMPAASLTRPPCQCGIAAQESLTSMPSWRARTGAMEMSCAVVMMAPLRDS
ncbi:MAG TPA: BTAD domain-containing putative transcriptional regulator [Streptosporangiaceae bacterium]|nr:BTAD domain-containing putative transcriptional regulator [Streptosporangiaceae bacterium]